MNTVLVDGRPDRGVPADDRGLAYGDGVFETIALHRGEPIWWRGHVARLSRGCVALGFAAPDEGELAADRRRIAGPTEHAVLKLVVTRGSGPRGYAAEAGLTTRRIVSVSPWNGPDAALAERGASLRWCDLALARQPRLAGLKHLNRLEQVLARREWSDPGIDEGLLCDVHGAVIGATAANLFLVRHGRLRTPALQHCGVAGVAREWVLQRADVEVTSLAREDAESADELFLTSSLRGILPVSRLAGRTLDVGPMTRALQRQLWQEEPGLRPVGVQV